MEKTQGNKKVESAQLQKCGDFSRASPTCIAADGKIASFLSAARDLFRYQKYGLGGMNINYPVETSRRERREVDYSCLDPVSTLKN